MPRRDCDVTFRSDGRFTCSSFSVAFCWFTEAVSVPTLAVRVLTDAAAANFSFVKLSFSFCKVACV